MFQSRNKNVHTSVAVHRNNMDDRSPPKMALGELNVTVGNCRFLVVAVYVVANCNLGHSFKKMRL
jgi:hypothetical protein